MVKFIYLLQMVQEALDTAKSGRTCIIVAHRLSTIRDCDQILYVDGGRVLESGTHDELMSLNGSYRNLVLKQELAE